MTTEPKTPLQIQQAMDESRRAEAFANAYHEQQMLREQPALGEELDRILFRTLSVKDQTKFRAWAREHYQPDDPIPAIWHPIVRDECARMNAEVTNEKDTG